jgi:hypothetical protein
MRWKSEKRESGTFASSIKDGVTESILACEKFLFSCLLLVSGIARPTNVLDSQLSNKASEPTIADPDRLALKRLTAGIRSLMSHHPPRSLEAK